MKISLALFFATTLTVAAQTREVPHKMDFAGMTLTIRDDARREIQKDVNALTQSPRHHNIKVERAKTYFPIIEKVFEEERVPDDFKYLVLQESALIADAVSVSNAVGFWQFKDFTAVEMGLRVDKEIDERLNIVSSTRAAAKYIKKNNFFFNNWLYALQAYQMGAGGVMKTVDKNQSGLKHMEITSSTYWYIKKYLAHKIAFEEDVKGKGQIEVVSYETRSKKELSDIAKEVSVDEAALKQYNKWAKKGTIPDDRTYTVVIPVIGDPGSIKVPASAEPTRDARVADATKATTGTFVGSAKGARIKINGIATIKANAAETPAQLAKRAGVDLSDFLKWNDISISDRIEADQYYLLGKKRVRGSEAYHKAVAGDNLWKVSQQYGVQMKKLKKYNRMSNEGPFAPGATIWLASVKPKDSEKALSSADIVQVDNAQSFSWTATPAATEEVQAQATVSLKPIVVTTPVVETTGKETLKTTDSLETIQANTTVADTVAQTAAITVISPPANNKDEHVVEAGETLYGIAQIYSLEVMDLVRWNNLNLQDGIRPGQVIKLKESQPIETDRAASQKNIEIVHMVKSTDTLYSVARKYNVTIKELMEWNNKKDFTLAVGEKLTIISK
ncbi:MAG TPA: LysM peptidoglycan-binding domain-containing protein [Chryseolinea sp.]